VKRFTFVARLLISQGRPARANCRGAWDHHGRRTHDAWTSAGPFGTRTFRW